MSFGPQIQIVYLSAEFGDHEYNKNPHEEYFKDNALFPKVCKKQIWVPSATSICQFGQFLLNLAYFNFVNKLNKI